MSAEWPKVQNLGEECCRPFLLKYGLHCSLGYKPRAESGAFDQTAGRRLKVVAEISLSWPMDAQRYCGRISVRICS